MAMPLLPVLVLGLLLLVAPGSSCIAAAHEGAASPPLDAALDGELAAEHGAVLWLRAMQLRPQPDLALGARQHLLNAQLRVHAQGGAGSAEKPRWTLHLDAEHWQAQRPEDWAWLRPAPDVRALGSPQPRLGARHASRLQLDWAYSSARQAGWQASLGRQPISRGLGRIWSVLDLHAPFQPLDLERLYKPGIDALLFDRSVSESWSSQSLISLHRETRSEPTTARGPRVWHVQQGLAWSRASDLGQLWLARRGAQTLIGMGAQRLDLAGGDWYLELLAHRGGHASAPGWQQRALLGNQYRLRPGWLLNLELLRQSAPQKPGLPDLGRGRHYLAAALNWEAHPLLQIDVMGLRQREDASGQLLLGLKWQIREAMELRAHWSRPFGGAAGSEFRMLGQALQLSLLMHH